MVKFFSVMLLLLASSAQAGPLELSSKWTSDSGAPVTLSQWKGKKVVLAMVYPRCTSACPFILAKLKKIQAKLDERGESAEFVLISLDSQDESAERLHSYREGIGATRPNWHFLFGKEKDVRYVSELINVRYWRNPQTKTISHDNVVLLFAEKGSVARRLEGLDAPVEELF